MIYTVPNVVPYSLDMRLKEDGVLLSYSSSQVNSESLTKLFAAVLAKEMAVAAGTIEVDKEALFRSKFLLKQVDATYEIKRAAKELRIDLEKLFTEGLDISMYISSYPEVFFDFALNLKEADASNFVKAEIGEGETWYHLKMRTITNRSFFFDFCTMLANNALEFKNMQCKRDHERLFMNANISFLDNRSLDMSDLYQFEDEIRGIL